MKHRETEISEEEIEIPLIQEFPTFDQKKAFEHPTESLSRCNEREIHSPRIHDRVLRFLLIFFRNLRQFFFDVSHQFPHGHGFAFCHSLAAQSLQQRIGKHPVAKLLYF